MKKRSRRAKSSEASRQPSRKQTTPSISEEMKTSGNKERPRKIVHVTTDSFYHDKTVTGKSANLEFSVTAADDTQKQSKPSGKCLSTNSVKLAGFAYQTLS